MATGSLLWLRHSGCFLAAAPLKCSPAPRTAVSPPVVVVSGHRNHQCDCSVRFLCPKSVIPIKKEATVRRDTIARSEVSAVGPVGDSSSSASGSAEREINLAFCHLMLSSAIRVFLESIAKFQLVSQVRAVLFYSVTAVAAIFLFATMAVVHPLVLLFDRHQRRFHHWIAKIWATLTIIPFYKFEFEGMENLPLQDAPTVYVSNHQSFLDIYTLLTIGRSFKFISKRSIFLFPIIGWAMYLIGVIPIARTDSRSQLDCLKRCMDFIKKGASVFFFPEGTRSKDGKLGTFKKGAFSVATKTGVPVLPITIMGTGKIMPPGREGIINSGAVKVVIHKPLDGKDAEKLFLQFADSSTLTPNALRKLIVVNDVCRIHAFGLSIAISFCHFDFYSCNCQLLGFAYLFATSTVQIAVAFRADFSNLIQGEDEEITTCYCVEDYRFTREFD
ncbi:hypothetical protein ZIOFF_030477 [Zingiber officinale]|uniref:1-acyl-sn-glycerol-3-phosphate acyltransferase n=1 Tax=Zingiber officinale TaxID=94328 RepID=A0A8J5LBG0_ZINOF|nr:hypothetical protein ZIOFF_030477 [Zingiber officinale]